MSLIIFQPRQFLTMNSKALKPLQHVLSPRPMGETPPIASYWAEALFPYFKERSLVSSRHALVYRLCTDTLSEDSESCSSQAAPYGCAWR